MSRYSGGVKALAWPACTLGKVVLATILRATVVSAQTSPAEPPTELTPAVPSPEPTGTEAEATDGSVPTAGPVPGWDYGLSVGVGYDGNIGFRGPDGPSSLAISPRGSLGRTFTSPRGDFRLDGGGNWYGYPEQSLLNRYNAYGGAGGHYRSSPRTTWEADAYYHLGYSDQSLVLSEQGVLLPLVRTRTAAARLGISRILGERTSLVVNGYLASVQFDEQGIGARVFVNGLTVRGSAGLRRKLGRRDSAALWYSLGASLAREPPGSPGSDSRAYYVTHYGSLRWEHVLSQRSALMLEGGASYTPEAQTAGLPRRVSFHGGVGYNLQVRRSDLRLFVRRSVTPAFGLGVSQVQTTMGIGASIPMGRAWTFRVTGRHSIPETPEGSTLAYGTSDDVYAGLWRGLGRHFAVSGEGRYRRRGASAVFPEIDSYQVGLFLSFAGPMRPGSSRIGRF